MPRDEQSIYVYIIKALILLKSALLFFSFRTLSFSLSYLRPRALFVVVRACGLVVERCCGTFFGRAKKDQNPKLKKSEKKKVDRKKATLLFISNRTHEDVAHFILDDDDDESASVFFLFLFLFSSSSVFETKE